MNVIKKRRVRLAMLRMGLQTSHAEERRDIRTLLRNPDAFETFMYMVEDNAGPDDVHTLGALTDFFDWFLENWESIYEIIKVIIGLFGGSEVSNDQ